MEKDYFRTKCSKDTEVRAYVKSKERRRFLRYKEKERRTTRYGDQSVVETEYSAKNDVHYVTTIVLEDGTELESYSEKVFTDVGVGNYINVKLSYYKLPNGKTLLYV